MIFWAFSKDNGNEQYFSVVSRIRKDSHICMHSMCPPHAQGYHQEPTMLLVQHAQHEIHKMKVNNKQKKKHYEAPKSSYQNEMSKQTEKKKNPKNLLFNSNVICSALPVHDDEFP